MSGPRDVLVAGKPLYRTTTHLVVNIAYGHFKSQHKSEKAAERELRMCRPALEYADLRVMPVAEALAKFGGAA